MSEAALLTTNSKLFWMILSIYDVSKSKLIPSANLIKQIYEFDVKKYCCWE